MLPQMILLDLQSMTARNAITGREIGPISDVTANRQREVEMLPTVGGSGIPRPGLIRSAFTVELLQTPEQWNAMMEQR